MTQLVFLISRYLNILLKKANSTQTLNVGINSPRTENAYTETMKYLLLHLHRFGLSLRFVLSLQSTVCIFVPSLHFVPSLQSAVCILY